MSNVSNRPVGVREYRFLGERLHVVQVDICCSWILSLIEPTEAKNCYSNSIADVSDTGEILKTLSGHVYEVNAVDTIDTGLWLSADEILICLEGSHNVTIINTDEKGEKASAEQLK